MKKLIITTIGIYRKWVSPIFPGSCRFYPTCSVYAMEAVDRYGALKGSVKAASRLMKCHPWHPGGYDPVLPENNSKFQIPYSKLTKETFLESEIWDMESDIANLHSEEGH